MPSQRTVTSHRELQSDWESVGAGTSMAQPSGPCSCEPITKQALSQVLFHNPSATKNLDLAAFRHLDRALPNDWQKRSPRCSAHQARDVAWANRATRLAAPEQCSNGSFDASLRCERSQRKPPGVPTFAEGQLRIVHAAATASDFELVLCSSNRATSGHQLVDELLPELFRDAWIGGPPASTVDFDEGGLRRTDGWQQHTLVCGTLGNE